jgi:hypothetical protein
VIATVVASKHCLSRLVRVMAVLGDGDRVFSAARQLAQPLQRRGGREGREKDHGDDSLHRGLTGSVEYSPPHGPSCQAAFGWSLPFMLAKTRILMRRPGVLPGGGCRCHVLLSFAAGNFIYIAASDLIPEVKHDRRLRNNLIHFAAFVAGIAVILATRILIGG